MIKLSNLIHLMYWLTATIEANVKARLGKLEEAITDYRHSTSYEILILLVFTTIEESQKVGSECHDEAIADFDLAN